MAAVSLDTVELETLVEACLTGKREDGLAALNLFRVKNGKEPINSSELVRPQPNTIDAALSGVQTDLNA
ncbi:hypothetical protein [Streptomyces sp. HNA39]|uniref:hypothetical protein n=1 Tax=Streptomyces sp. HNA39 TaxID=2850561 RepID=UPI00200F09AD|nr:hypothetical protein [Streptomyces sp. HNA39]UQA37498.1 hypothetical protein KRR37_30070 [Streptomyces sp. HNA39]